MKKYLNGLKEEKLITTAVPDEIESLVINHVTYDSRDVKEGTLFICKGAHFSVNYLKDAAKKGAVAYISETKYDVDLPAILVSDIRPAIATLANLYYDFAWKRLVTIGITGTKGKSSTTYFVRSIIDEAVGKCAVLSGIDNYDGVISEESHLTTAEALELHQHFKNAADSGIKNLVMEVSSQALKYQRTKGIEFSIACFLNVGRDHISPIEHPTVEDYVQSKLILMEQCKTAIVNLESDFAAEAMEIAKERGAKLVTFGVESSTRKINAAEIDTADWIAKDIEPCETGIKFRVKGPNIDEPFEIGLKGVFNVSNALAAIAICHEAGIPLKAMQKGLKKARVSGRMELFVGSDGKVVIVDYAHNVMSFEALFESVEKEYPGRPVQIVYGCPGKKAFERRKDLAEIAARYCSKIYITEEDAGEEDVMAISREIASYIEPTACDYEIICDRGEAIKTAIESAPSDAVILLTGKGRETRQKRGVEYIDTPSDVEYTESFLK